MPVAMWTCGPCPGQMENVAGREFWARARGRGMNVQVRPRTLGRGTRRAAGATEGQSVRRAPRRGVELGFSSQQAPP